VTEWNKLVDRERKTVSPRVFTDLEVYRAEQERVFGHCWLYVAHETQLAHAGDFVTNWMGEEPVVVTRDLTGRVRVFINSCRHRGMRVCRVDEGNTRVFQCPYHGWTYDVQGRLVGVPQYQESYYGELRKEEWGLLEAPRVESYRGMIFASFDAGIESLDTYLGEMKWYLDIVLNRTAGGWTVLPGVHKWTLKGNWKLAAEQFGGDNYHVTAAHESMGRLGLVPPGKTSGDEPWVRDFQVRTDKGHGWINLAIADPPAITESIGAYQARVQREARQRLQPAQSALVGCAHVGTIFPNCSLLFFAGFLTVRLWHPRGPDRMEVWSWGLVETDAPPAVAALARKMHILTFSPSGIFEQDDGEMWGECVETMGGVYRRRFPLNYQMGAGHGRQDPEKPGLIHPPSTEIGVFGFYERWHALMTESQKGER
jgi:phenylpropionate dioxygenase-like ring-hydroxylating dioxygenase large terminal subunit